MIASVRKTPDVTVVGAGVIGLATSLRLATAGVRVLLVDPSHKLEGSASSAAGAMLGAFGEITRDEMSTPAGIGELELRIRAADGYGSWLEEVGELARRKVPLGSGTMIVGAAQSERDQGNVEAICRQLERFGRRHEWVESHDVKGFRPGGGTASSRALYVPDEGFVDTSVLLESLRTAVGATGGVDFLDDTAMSMDVAQGHVRSLQLRRTGRVHTGCVVLCTGAAVGDILANTPGVALAVPPILPGKGVSAVAKAMHPPPYVLRTANRAFACGIHVVPREAQAAVYIGATNRVASRMGATGRATLGEIHLLLDQAITQINRELARADLLSVSFGSRPICLDRLPAVGCTEIDGLAVASGTYRNGVLLAPLVAEIVASELAKGHADPENLYSPVGRAERLRAAGDATQDILARAASDLVSMLLEPDGRLPYAGAEELGRFFEVSLSIAMKRSETPDEWHPAWTEVLRRFPLEEMVPEVFFGAVRDEPEVEYHEPMRPPLSSLTP